MIRTLPWRLVVSGSAIPRWPLRLLVPVAAFLAAGCSENFGVPPKGVPDRIAVEEEGFASPVDVQRSILLMRGAAQDLVLGTDRGVYRLRPGTGQWLPGPDRLGFRRLRDLASSPDGRLWLASTGQELFFSHDGGEIYRDVPLPVAGSPVEAVAVLPPSPSWPEGAWMVLTGAAVYLSAAGSSQWSASSLPAGVVAWDGADADTQGRVALAVQTDAGPVLWKSQDGGRSFLFERSWPLTPPLALALLPDGTVVSAHPEGLRQDGTLVGSPGPGAVVAAALRPAGSGAEVFLLDDASRFWWGRSDGGLASTPAEGEPDPAAGLVAISGGGFYLGTDRAVRRLLDGVVTTWDFQGGLLSMGAVIADPQAAGEIVLAGGPRGEVWHGPPGGPYQSLGRPGGPSVAALLADPLQPGAFFAATFGVQHLDPGTGLWQDRNNGQSSYLCDAFFGGPVIAHTLASRPGAEGELWLGAINGDGPYRSRDDGRSWQKVHENLGPLGSCIDEPGLSRLTQARAFVFLDGRVWMGGFRGGVFVRDESVPQWKQWVEGLPDVMGDVVDTCCVEPLARAVDVRDLVALDDGTLLAATGWGIYRLEPGAQRWEPSLQGLRNFDAQRLAPHPLDSSLVLAGCSSTVDVPRWLFLSRDGGRSWIPVDSTLKARRLSGLAWSDAGTLEAVAILDWSGAWRVKISR